MAAVIGSSTEFDDGVIIPRRLRIDLLGRRSVPSDFPRIIFWPIHSCNNEYLRCINFVRHADEISRIGLHFEQSEAAPCETAEGSSRYRSYGFPLQIKDFRTLR
jgi:hypothetical protein